jgi:mRNA-degrading endonuclease toxin of MazEF toxin-antitoxin module
MVRLDPGETGLTAPSVVNLSQLLTIAQERLLAWSGGTAPRLIGQVGSPKMAEVDRALRISLGL